MYILYYIVIKIFTQSFIRQHSVCTISVSVSPTPVTTRSPTGSICTGTTSKTVSQSRKTCLSPVDSDWLESFCIPWDDVPKPVLRKLKQNVRLTKCERTYMIKPTMDQILHHVKKPRKKELEVVAKAMVKKYPKALEDRFGGRTVGHGYETLLNQLINKRDNLRTPSVKKRDSEDSDESETDLKMAKTAPKHSYGCVDWSPSPSQYKRGTPEYIYALQRKFINSGGSVEQLQQKWPDLFTCEGFATHVNRLVGINIKNTLKDSLASKGRKMLDFMENKSATCELIKQVKEANKERTMIDVPLTLMAYFKEDYTVLFVEVKVH